MLGAFLGYALSNLLFVILHVTGSGSFPRPLTAKEEREYLERFQKWRYGSQKQAKLSINLRWWAHII